MKNPDSFGTVTKGIVSTHDLLEAVEKLPFVDRVSTLSFTTTIFVKGDKAKQVHDPLLVV